ncbi:hypothetical protein BJ875DRAFT_380121 [Amylocarpus encephaloides]|uniref:Uncharacterized protein n=1 Tax=Amylocarpus encephaloides TaxID=45428 RepID=A0A9P8C3M1_9HELO|nr:hypothetical protein BJ875DRAFT_380121 [Amylocarpus encephaloides]
MEIHGKEHIIARDKLAKYKGTAKVLIAHLDFPYPLRQENRKIVKQLKRDFEGENCNKENPTNRIPAIINESTLQVGLQKLGTSTEAFKIASTKNPPHLTLRSDIKLECLHGQYRILAAKEFLPPSEWWWILDLYSPEGYSYSALYASGEVFRHIRLCHYNNNTLGEQRWQVWLSPNQEKYLEIILKQETLIKALDSVLHIQGL